MNIEIEAHILTDVRETTSGWEIGHDSAFLHIPKDSPIVPEVGMEAVYIGGFGRPVRGLFINGVTVWYRTADQQQAYMDDLVRQDQERQKVEFEEQRAALDADFADLPEPFQKWMQKFRDENPDYRWKIESYDMCIARDAVKIANAFETDDQLKTFSEWGWEQQNKAVPNLDKGHSGNTFGMAVRMARLYKLDHALVERFHSGMCMLAGCEGVGHKIKEPA